MDEGAKRNLPIFNKVKKGDIILVPRINRWDGVVIVQALEDWNSSGGYDFKIARDYRDYGHCFSAKIIGEFVRNNVRVSGAIKSTLKTPSRFWNISYLKEDIEELIKCKEDLMLGTTLFDIANSMVKKSLEESDLESKIFNNFIERFQASEWEYVLTEIYREIYPNYIVEHASGKEEKEHGADILIKIPGISGEIEYVIAIQVKDYRNQVSSSVIDQINKSEKYFEVNGSKNQGVEEQEIILIDKYIFITNTTRDINEKLEEYKGDVKIFYEDDLRRLLFKYVIRNDEWLD